MDKSGKRLSPALAGWLLIVVLLVVSGCQKKTGTEAPGRYQEQLKEFSLQQFSEKIDVGITGASAEVSPDKTTAAVKEPVISLKSEDGLIEISTGPEGRAEVRLAPGNQALQEAVLEGQVRVVQKDVKTGRVTMEADCRRLSYLDKQKLLTMEGSPVVRRERDRFSGERILYYWTENRIEIRGKVNVLIHPEKSPVP